MCFRSEPYPWGKSQCLPMYGSMRELPDRPDSEANVMSLKDRVHQAMESVRRQERERRGNMTTKLCRKSGTASQARRFTIELTPMADKELRRICALTGLTVADCFRYGLVLTTIYVDAMLAGKTVYLQRAGDREMEIVTIPRLTLDGGR